ncbi:hypothetical protein HGA88_03755 [Candidatus Roizmanbacteria bacterium]|nr:hypothetical protein [Candidatus Roizmanbacteria bacterium]
MSLEGKEFGPQVFNDEIVNIIGRKSRSVEELFDRIHLHYYAVPGAIDFSRTTEVIAGEEILRMSQVYMQELQISAQKEDSDYLFTQGTLPDIIAQVTIDSFDWRNDSRVTNFVFKMYTASRASIETLKLELKSENSLEHTSWLHRSYLAARYKTTQRDFHKLKYLMQVVGLFWEEEQQEKER